MVRVLIRGAGDLASGIACRLVRSGFSVVMTELPIPTTVRRTVAFSPAVYLGTAQVEDISGERCATLQEAEQLAASGKVAVLVDEDGALGKRWNPDVVVDAIIAKRNLGTAITDAPVVIGVGPGFTAGVDCHCVVETMRGHNLGRCIYQGSAIPNTGIPGEIGGYTTQRVLRSPCTGVFQGIASIGQQVSAGETVAMVDGQPVCTQISGVVRGLLQDGVSVREAMKVGDVDPRCAVEHCFTVSDKARAIGGGVLEGILHLSGYLRRIG